MIPDGFSCKTLRIGPEQNVRRITSCLGEPSSGTASRRGYLFLSRLNLTGGKIGKDLSDLGEDVVAVGALESMDAHMIPTIRVILARRSLDNWKTMDICVPRRVEEERE